MAIPGTKPKEEGQKANRVPVVHEWTEVEDVPYLGKRPGLNAKAPKETRAWWNRVTRLPHCVLWDEGDWQFALDTSRIHAAFIGGDLVRATELRIRESQMGTTLDARRDLRIRYVTRTEEPETRTDDDAVDFEAERRRRLMDAG